MKLHKLKVAGWRCFDRPLELQGLTAGINIVCGPNGIGKSSLFHAIVRIFADKHDAKSEAIRNLQAWGTELGPSASLEFEHQGVLWQGEKRFLHSPLARLSRFDGQQFQLIAEGKQADEKLRAMLQLEASRTGVLQNTDWGLAQVLWAAQGQLPIEKLSTPARDALQNSLGAQIAGSEVVAVEARVQKEYDLVFTNTGKIKSGANAPAITGLKERLRQTQTKCEQLRLQLQNYDAAVQRIQERRAFVQQAELELAASLQQANALQIQAEAYAQLVHERDLATKEYEAARLTANRLRERREQIAVLRHEQQTLDQKRKQFAEQLPQLQLEKANREKIAADTQAEVAKVRARRDEIQVAEERAKQADVFLRIVTLLRNSSQLLEKIAALSQRLERLKTDRATVHAPDSKTLSLLRTAFKERDEARVRYEASLITLEFTAEAKTEIELLSSHPASQQHVAVGERYSAQGSPEVVLRIAGIGTFRASGPTASVAELHAALSAAETRLATRLQPFPTHDLSELEGLSQTAAEIDRELRDTQTRIEATLGSRQRSELEREVQQAEKQRNDLLFQHPAWEASPPDPVQLAAECSQLVREFKSQIDGAELARDSALKQLNATLTQLSTAEGEQRHIVERQTAVQKQLADFLADGQTDAEREEAYGNAAIQFQGADGKLKGLLDKLAKLGADPRQSAQRQQQRVDDLRKSLADAISQLRHDEGSLAQQIANSPYSALATAEEEESRLTEEITRQERQLSAIKLLHETLAKQRRTAEESLVQPVRQHAERIMQRIMGSRFRELDLAEDFSAAGIRPTEHREAVKLPELSGGEREQVYFAMRLALAEVAFPSGGELLILDDVFTFTDRERLRQINILLSEMASRFQIVLLTCHPERYQGLPDAKFFDLEKLRQPESASNPGNAEVIPPPKSRPRTLFETSS